MGGIRASPCPNYMFGIRMSPLQTWHLMGLHFIKSRHPVKDGHMNPIILVASTHAWTCSSTISTCRDIRVRLFLNTAGGAADRSPQDECVRIHTTQAHLHSMLFLNCWIQNELRLLAHMRCLQAWVEMTSNYLQKWIPSYFALKQSWKLMIKLTLFSPPHRPYAINHP